MDSHRDIVLNTLDVYVGDEPTDIEFHLYGLEPASIPQWQNVQIFCHSLKTIKSPKSRKNGSQAHKKKVFDYLKNLSKALKNIKSGAGKL